MSKFFIYPPSPLLIYLNYSPSPTRTLPSKRLSIVCERGLGWGTILSLFIYSVGKVKCSAGFSLDVGGNRVAIPTLLSTKFPLPNSGRAGVGNN